MFDKSKLGSRYICFQCGTKFYDLNKPTPSCPECQADQGDAPAQDMRRMLSSRGKRKVKDIEEPVEKPKSDEDDDLGLDDDDNLGLDEVDDDDDDDDDDVDFSPGADDRD